jgi:phosphomannomutase
VAGVLGAHGLEVLCSEGPVPTPALSFAVVHHGAAGGVMLTASHNPPQYQGFKLKGPYGGTATEAIYRDVARRVAALTPGDVRGGGGAARVQRFDIRDAYYGALAELVDVERLRSLRGTVVHDAMGGAAGGWLRGFAERYGLPLRVEDLRGAPHPLFYGVDPEPIARNLALTRERMLRGDALFAVATDGDGDRLGLVLPDGTFFNSHQIFAVLLDALAGRGVPGRVVKTFTVSRIVERLAELRGRRVVEVPVGFKYIVDAMLEGDVLIGGEESGGIGVAGHLPERDGVANALLLLEAMAASGMDPGARFAELERETLWRHAYRRVDVRLKGTALKDAVMAALGTPPAAVAGRAVTSTERRDGVKLNLEGDAWLLFRPSGTEPVLRLYCEAPDAEAVDAVLQGARNYVEACA